MTQHPFLPRLALAAALSISTAAAPAAIVTSTVVDTGDMQAAEWTQQVQRDDGPASVAVSLAASGGNGGSFWLHELARPLGPGNSSNVVANLFGAASWDPATQGAVTLIDFALDARGLFSTGIGTPVTGFVRPVIEQGGVIYSVAGTSTRIDVGTAWQTIHRLFSDSDNWIDLSATPGVRPDFSDDGGVIHFGYRYELSLTCSSSTVGCNAANTRLGVDNFRVMVSTEQATSEVPEPPAGALLAVALLGLAWAGRRAGRRRPVRH